MTKILLVEDDPLLVNIYTTFFRNKGLESVVAVNGSTALDKVKEYKPDIILLDLMMPKLGGLGVLEELNKAGNKAPVIIYTNLDSEEKRKEAMDKGATDFISKSHSDPQDVLDVINKHLPSV